MIDAKKTILGAGKRPAAQDDATSSTEGGDRKHGNDKVESPALIELVKVMARLHVRATLERRHQVSKPAQPQVPRRA